MVAFARAALARWRAGALLLTGLLVGAAVAASMVLGPNSTMLIDRDGASWIVYPMPPRGLVRPAVELTTRFTRSFDLPRGASGGWVELRAFRDATITVNGRPVHLAPAANWKDPRRAELEGVLRAGRNQITVACSNDSGPPALLLLLEAGETRVVSDGSWSSSLEGSPEHPARLAAAPIDVTSIDPATAEVRPWAGLRAHADWLIVYTALAMLALWALGRWPGWRRDEQARWVWLLFAIFAATWIAQFLNNAPSLWSGDGFDGVGHLEYIRFVQERGRLPLADDGWSMFHPPLYYVLSAALLWGAGLSTLDPTGIYLLRAQGAVYGIALLACILAGLRELFPRRPAEQVAGLIVAAALPVHLLMYQFVGNDGLAATLSAAAIWILLRGMRTGLMRPGVTAGIGACLGGAMLAKTSALVPTLVIFGTLAAAPLLIRLPIRQWLGGLASAAGIFLLVCGWHYARVAARFGSPLVGNWDRAAWHPWWQDPGYLTPSFYLEFGRSLRQPVMSSVNSLIDGVYATAWGDGQRAGFTELIYAPPWNIDGMGAGYLLALFPSVLMLIGFAVLLNAAVRRGGSNWLMLVLAAASIGAVALWPFRLPIYSVIKASFATPAALAWCALAGAGFGALRRRSRVAGQLASVLLVVWALNAYATHWLPRSDPQVRARIGLQYATVGEHPELAARYLQQALEADPANPNALLGAAILANQAGDLAETEEQLESLLREHPDHAEGHLALAHVLEGTRRPLEALQHYRAAARIRPSFSGAQLGAGRILLGFGRIEEAAVPLQSAIVLLPEQAPQIRAALVSARSRGNDPAETPE